MFERAERVVDQIRSEIGTGGKGVMNGRLVHFLHSPVSRL